MQAIKEKSEIQKAVSYFDIFPRKKKVEKKKQTAEFEMQVFNNKSLDENRWSFEFPSQISFDIADEQNQKQDKANEIKYQSIIVEPKDLPNDDF